MRSGVSVLTLAKGRAEFLIRLIEGLRHSEVMPAELIVIDMDGDWVAPAATFPIRVIPMGNSGLPLAAARNAAAQAAVSESLFFLDVDCIPMPSVVGAIGHELAEMAALICVEVRYLAPGQSPDRLTEQSLWRIAQPHPVRAFPERGSRRERNYGLFWSLAFAIRRSQFLTLGGFDEGFTGYGAEDTDFGFRAEAAGVPLMFHGGEGAVHQHHAVFDPPLQHFADIVRNARRFYGKWRIWPMMGWLEQFAGRGLIRLGAEDIEIKRQPTPAEVLAARVERPF